MTKQNDLDFRRLHLFNYYLANSQFFSLDHFDMVGRTVYYIVWWLEKNCPVLLDNFVSVLLRECYPCKTLTGRKCCSRIYIYSFSVLGKV